MFCRSEMCFHPSALSVIYFFQAAKSLSNDTARISKFLSLKLLYRVLNAGISSRLCLFQDAQKLTRTYFPLRFCKPYGSPATSNWVIPGAFLPGELFSSDWI